LIYARGSDGSDVFTAQRPDSPVARNGLAQIWSEAY
jgi:hypothetical protein